MFKEKAKRYFISGLIALWLLPMFRGLPMLLMLVFMTLCLQFTTQLWKEEDCKHNYVDKEYKVYKWTLWSGKSCTKCTHQIGK